MAAQAAGQARKEKLVTKRAFYEKTPTKDTINFAAVGTNKIRWQVVIPLALAILIAGALFTKFLVADRISSIYEVHQELESVRQELDAANAEIDSYGELNSIYAHYTYSGNTAEELARVDRVSVMSLMERIVMTRVDVSSWSVSGNQISMSVVSRSLQVVRDMVDRLTEDDMVDYCVIGNAVASGESGSVSANVVVRLNDVKQ